MVKSFQLALYDGQVSYPLWVWVDEKRMQLKKTVKAAFVTADVGFDTFDPLQHPQQASDKIMVTKISQHEAPHVLVSMAQKLDQLADTDSFMELNQLQSDHQTQQNATLDQLYYQFFTFKQNCSELEHGLASEILLANQHTELLISASLEINSKLIAESFSGRELAMHNARHFCKNILEWFLLGVVISPLTELRNVLHCKLLNLSEFGNIFSKQHDSQLVNVDNSVSIVGAHKISNQKPVYKTSTAIPKLFYKLENLIESPKPTKNSPETESQTVEFSEISSIQKQSSEQPSIYTIQNQTSAQSSTSPKLSGEFLLLNQQGNCVQVPLTMWKNSEQTLHMVEQYAVQSNFIKMTFHQNPQSQTLQTVQTFHSVWFDDKQIIQAIKFLSQETIMNRILTTFYSNQFHVVIVGPTQIANLLGRSLSVMLPPYMRNRVVYASDQQAVVYCSHVEMAEGELLQSVEKKIKRDRIGISVKENVEKPNKGRNLFCQKQVCPVCKKARHLPQLIPGCSIQCINGDYKSFHVDDFLQLGHQTCVINLLATSEDDFIVNYSNQKGFQNCAKLVTKLKIAGDYWGLLQMYQNANVFVQYITHDTQNIFSKINRGSNFVQMHSLFVFSMTAYLGEVSIGHFVQMAVDAGFYSQSCILDPSFRQIQLDFVTKDLRLDDIRLILLGKGKKAKLMLNTSSKIVSGDKIKGSLNQHTYHRSCRELLGGFFAFNAPQLINCPFVKGGDQEYQEIIYKYIMEYFITEILGLLEINSPLAL